MGLRAAALGLLLSAVACTGPLGCSGTTGKVTQLDTEEGRLLVIVTVDWEGRELDDANLAAMEELRGRFPEVPLVQFLNAAYYTKPGADPADTTARIQRGLLPIDELGLHIHGWKSLFETSGVTFRDTPTFWDEEARVTGCSFDCGHEVPISAYEVDEIEAVIRTSVDLLEAQGFGRATGFRAGGWMASDGVREALARQGFVTENSAVPATLLSSEIGHLPLHAWVGETWPGITTTSQPYELAQAPLLEIPDNGALADYVDAAEMFTLYETLRTQLEVDPRRDVVLSIGFHQETAARYAPRIEVALDEIMRDAEVNGVPVEFVTAHELAARPR